MKVTETEVLIVGAGPVGLLLAAELRLAGVMPTVVERRVEPSLERRARGVGPLAAEALRRRGLGEQLSARHPQGATQKSREHGSEKDHFAWLHKIDPTLQDAPDRRGVLIWQADLEALLGEYVSDLGIAVDRGRTVTALDQDAAAVRVTTVTDTGEERTWRAGYVVGCDGGRSTVRTLAGFAFPGTPPIMVARQAQADLRDGDTLPPSGRTPAGMLIHAPGVIGTFEFDHLPEHRDAPVTRDEVQASVRRVSGADVTIAAMGPALRFTDAAFQVDTYRRGRVLLAGDAAHVHSPNGGQGLNLGLMDATNLGWKLAAHIRGTAPAALLDTYSDERHPVGAAVLHNTRAQSALMRPGPHVDALRDIVSDLMDLREVNRYFGRLLSGVAARYDVPYAGPDVHPLVGTHCPDLTFVGRTGRRERLSDHTTDGYAVLLVPATAREHPSAVIDRLRVVEATAPDHPDVDAVLIRPDGIIAWAAGTAHPADARLLDTALEAWFGA